MLSKCANPECSEPFQYLRSGKLFLLPVDSVSPNGGPAGPQLVEGQRSQRKVEHFWLCGSCIKTMTLAYDPGKGVVMVPHGTPMRRAAAG